MYAQFKEQRLISGSTPAEVEEEETYIDMPVTLYIDYLSQPSRAIVLFCRAAKIDHKEHLLNLMKGEHKQESYLKINPKGQVPAIAEGDFCLTETTAILRYIATTRKIEDHWYPKDSKKRARVDEYLSWQPTELRAAGSGLFITAGFTAMAGKEVDEELMKEKRAKMDQTCANFEKCFLIGDKPFIGGADKPSVADIWAAAEVTQALSVGYKLDKSPKMAAWYDKVKSEFPDWDDLAKAAMEIGGMYKPPQ